MRRAITAVVVGAAAVAVVLWQLGIILPPGGPMDGIGAQAGFTAEAGSEVAAAFHLPNERLESAVEIRSIEPVGVSPQLEVTDVAIGRCPDSAVACTSLGYRRWPPRNMVLEEPEGYELTRNDHALVLVRVRLPEGEMDARIRGVRIDYADGWRRYKAEVGPSMVINSRA